MKLIVGLGNVGKEFAGNRHNLGFKIADELAGRWQFQFGAKKDWQAEVAEGEVKGEKLILAKPTTMMNLSGDAVAKIARFYKIEPANIWIIHDELDLPFGSLRVRPGGSSAGNNGVQSIIDSIGENFYHWRTGIGRPTGQMAAKDYVLQNFSAAESKSLSQLIRAAADIVESELPYEPTAASYSLTEPSTSSGDK